MGCEDAGIAGQVLARARDQRGETLEKLALGQGDSDCAVAPGTFERVGEAAVG